MSRALPAPPFIPPHENPIDPNVFVCVGGILHGQIVRYAGKVVPLCDGTLALLESLGFEPLARARAHLVKETIHAGIFADVTQKTERKSFFRRLAEKKGSPRIDWEEVLFVRAPGATP